MDFDDYLSTTEVAEMLDIDVRSVARKARKGLLEGVFIGRTWFIKKTSVEAYIQSTEGLSKFDPKRGKKSE